MISNKTPIENINFFLVIHPGFEALALQELKEKDVFLQTFLDSSALMAINEVPGGIEFVTSLENALILQRRLRIPSRLLMRLGQFKAFEFPQILKGMKKINWKILKNQIPSGYSVASQKSKLGQEKRVEKVIREFFQKEMGSETGNGPELFVRVMNDQFTLSVDLSGEHLHFRGYRLNQGEAPLRENFAAGVFYYLTQQFSKVEKQKLTFIDPFLGSGTFIAEAELFNQENTLRSYAGETLTNSQSNLKNEINSPLAFAQYIGAEIDSKTAEIAKENLLRVISSKIVDKQLFLMTGDNKNLKAELSRKGTAFKPSIIIGNPPYGERLKANSKEIQNLLASLVSDLHPIIAGFIVPQSWVAVPVEHYKIEDDFHFKNNGLPVKVIVYRKTL